MRPRWRFERKNILYYRTVQLTDILPPLFGVIERDLMLFCRAMSAFA